MKSALKPLPEALFSYRYLKNKTVTFWFLPIFHFILSILNVLLSAFNKMYYKVLSNT